MIQAADNPLLQPWTAPFGLPPFERIELAPRIAAHANAILLDAALFARVDALHGRRDALGLAPEERKLLGLLHLDLATASARLAP